MPGDDTFMVLTASDLVDKVIDVFSLPQNARWFRPARNTGSEGDAESINVDQVDRLEITFSGLMEQPACAILAGTDPSAHILLGCPESEEASGRQWRIVVDHNLCIWLHDYHSKNGSAVVYDGNVHLDRELRNDSWILAHAPGTRSLFERLDVLSGGCDFRVRFPHHEVGSASYVEKLRSLVRQCDEANAEDWGDTQESRMDVDAHDSLPRHLYEYKGVIRGGAIAKVHSAIRVRDGMVVAVKEYHLNDDPQHWDKLRNEFAILSEHRHPNIVEVLEMQVSPRLLITMPLFKDGDLTDAHDLNFDDGVTMLGQLLDAVCHLQNHGIAHRDIKPSNILLKRGHLFKAVLIDFDLAEKVTPGEVMSKICGTRLYMAPEIYPTFENRRGYTALVDIWSLGVVASQFFYGIPRYAYKPASGTDDLASTCEEHVAWAGSWKEQLASRSSQARDCSLFRLVGSMIQINPLDRECADWCLGYGFHKNLFKRRDEDGLVSAVSR